MKYVIIFAVLFIIIFVYSLCKVSSECENQENEMEDKK